MSAPEDAVAHARDAAAQMRTDGAYVEVGAQGPEVKSRTVQQQLHQWAFLAPDPSQVRSTRRLGKLITAVKLALLRFLEQYHVLLTSEQTRFNLTLLEHVRSLERRIEELEARSGEGPR